jgi:hypothetical protein
MIKLVSNEISRPLAHIFNLSLRSGVFSDKLKMCRVIPIFKTCNKLECDNYRPISLLSSVSKVLEKIVAEKFIEHLLVNDLLYVHQYGFLPKQSTQHNLIQIVNYISNDLNEGNFCIGHFLDLKKAFNVCSH